MNHVSMIIQAIIYKSKEPITGYDITKMIQGKSGNQHQQVYRELSKIANRDDILVQTVPQSDRPDKKIYSFKKKSKFVYEFAEHSDLSKTNIAYRLLLEDIMYGTDNYDDYVKSMSRFESRLLKKYEKKNELKKNKEMEIKTKP